jgi:S1-C subfamily serine protease
VLVEVAGRTITNIYDYTYALELLKIGEPVKVVYMRAGQRRETTLTPAARR